MSYLVTCDHPNHEDNEPLDTNTVVSITVTVNDPETGQTSNTRHYCTDHGDDVLGNLSTVGFPAE